MSTTIDTINATAKDCATFHREQGWQGTGHGYDLGSFHGDAEALRDALGREPTKDERVALEHEIRSLLTFTA